jgi:hypothetical protein
VTPITLRCDRDYIYIRISDLTNFRGASFASPALDKTNLSPEQAPAESAESLQLVCPYDKPRLLLRNRFLRHCFDPPPSTPGLTTADGVLPPLHGQPIDSHHLAEQSPVQMSLGQQQPVTSGVLDQSPTSLHQPLSQGLQRLDVNSLRQHQTAPQIAQAVCQQAQL